MENKYTERLVNGKDQGCVMQEFAWRFVLNNGKKIDEIVSSRESLKSKRFWKTGMDNEIEACFSDVSNFPLRKPILLRGVRTRDSIGITIRGEVIGKGTFCKFRATITLEELDCGGEEVFCCSFELLEVREGLGFLSEWKDPTKMAIIINKNSEVSMTRKRKRQGRAPNITMVKL